MGKRAFVILGLVSLSLIGSGCSEDDVDGSSIYGITVDWVEEVRCGDGYGDPCYYKLYIDYYDSSAGQQWYRTKLMYGKQSTLSKPRYFGYHDGTAKIYDSILAPYYDFDGNFELDLEVYRYTSAVDARLDSNHAEAAACSVSVAIGDFGDGCRECCCTDTNFTVSRWYAMAHNVYLSDVVGARADLWMPSQVPVMCADGLAVSEDASFAYVDMSDDSSPFGCWCQTGFLAVRFDGHVETSRFIYFEVNAGNDWDFTIYPAPPPSSWVNLGCLVEPSEGRCHLYYEGIPQYSFIKQYWAGRHADRIDMTGEIVHRETDMWGTQADPVKWDNVEYDVGYGWITFPVAYLSFEQDDTAEWMSESVGGEIHVFDRRPQYSKRIGAQWSRH